MHTHRQWGIWEFHLEDDPGAAVAPRDNATFADDWTRNRLERMVRQDAGLAARLRGLLARHGHTTPRALTADQLVHEVLRLAAVGRIGLAFTPLDLTSLPQVAGAAAASSAASDDSDADAGSSDGASDAASSDDAAGDDATSDASPDSSGGQAAADGDAAQDGDTSDAPSDASADTAAQPQKTWIEIQLLGEDGKPISGERYEIQLPDGSTRQGTLDDQGLARVDQIDPGTCQVSFPALDQDAWTAIEADGA